MTFEAAMIGFVIPSLTIDSIRKVQIVLNQALIGHSLPDSRLSQNHINKNKNKNDLFTASKYLYVSHYVARHLNWLPEATFILNYIDPYPHVEYQTVLNNKYRSSNGGNGNSNSHTIIPIDQNSKNNNSR